MKKLILLGGGMDSTTLMIDEHKQGHELVALFVDYNQKAYENELKSVRHFCYKYKIPLQTIKVELDAIAESFIIKGYDETDGNCLEGRNAIFLHLAVTYAALMETKEILLGFHLPPEGYSFPDSHEPFINKFNDYVDSFLNEEFKGIRATIPYKDIDRYDIFKKAMELDEDIIEKSFSCYDDKETECGVCNHCVQKDEMRQRYKNG